MFNIIKGNIIKMLIQILKYKYIFELSKNVEKYNVKFSLSLLISKGCNINSKIS